MFGSNVRTRNCILIAYKKDKSNFNLYATGLTRWFASERKKMFNKLKYQNVSQLFQPSRGIPKVDNKILLDIFYKMFDEGYKIEQFKSKNGYFLYFKNTAYNWITVCKKIPKSYLNDGSVVYSNEYGKIGFQNIQLFNAAFLVLNSKLFFLYWLTFGDAFHLTSKLIESFPINLLALSKKYTDTIHFLSQKLEEKMEQNIDYKLNAGLKIGNYNLLKCRDITDEIDQMVLDYYSLPYVVKDLDAILNVYIKTNYEIKFRTDEKRD